MVRPGGFGKTGDGWVSHTMPIADRPPARLLEARFLAAHQRAGVGGPEFH
jgi:hypothetical protein